MRIPIEQREEVAREAREIRFRRGETLASPLKANDGVILLVEGLAKLVGVETDGREWILEFLRPGNLVDVQRLNHDEEHGYAVVGMSPGRALSIPRPAFRRLAERDPNLLLDALSDMTESFSRLADHALEIQAIDVRGRLCRLLLEFVPAEDAGRDGHVALDLVVTHEDLAQAVGASRPHTSSELGILETLGAVVRRGRRGILVNPRRLEELTREEVARRS